MTAQTGTLSITLTRAEGKEHECGRPVSVASFAEANATLHAWAATAPKNGGYDKCDFLIVWQDGGTYNGRYDLKHYQTEPASLTRHMVDLAEFYTGQNCPDHMGAEDYRAYCDTVAEDTRAAYAEVLETMAALGEYTAKARPISMDLRLIISSGVPFSGLVGLGVIYTGDNANPSGVGAIMSAEPCQWSGVRAVVRLEDGREMQPTASQFGDKAGDRFRLDWKNHGAPYMAQLDAAHILRKARTSSAKELEKQAHAKALQELATQFPQLKRAEDRHAGGKLAAVNMRILLKEKFKGVKFSVTSDYNSVRVSWTGGPTDKEVNDVIGRFDIGAADTQSDYFYTVSTAFSELFGGVQYLNTSRTLGDAEIQAALTDLYGEDAPTVQDWRNGTPWTMLRQGKPDLNRYHGDNWAWLPAVRRRANGSN